MAIRIIATLVLSVAMLIMVANLPCYGYEDKVTHPALTLKAIDASSLRQYLKQNYGNLFQDGFESSVNGQKIRAWLTGGSTAEDALICRRSTHFHNPLRSWKQAGMDESPVNITCTYPNSNDYRQPGYNSKYSALTWATGYEDYKGTIVPRNNQDMGWDKARTYFYSALTSTVDDARDAFFAKTFQAVGQVMHLLQDMAVPAHVRNDFITSHLNQDGMNNPYELYVSKPENKYLITDLQSVVKPLLTMTSDYWDTVGGDSIEPPQITNPMAHPQAAAGLAEYTNANFLSEGTLFWNSTAFKYPRQGSTEQVPVTIPDESGQSKQRMYYRKTGDWDSGFYLAAVPFWQFWNPEANPPSERVLSLDELVHKNYAERLLPRAVGYSAALLDYFFRGTIEIGLSDDGVYAITGPDGTFEKIKLKARNSTVNGEAMNNGTIELVVKYKTALTDPFQMHSDCIEKTDYYSYIVVPEASNLTSLPTTSTTLTFDLTGSAIPLWATDVYLQIVYKGQLGNEAKSVAVGFKDISEPTPLDLRNDMDWVCINGTNYPTGSAEANAAFIAALGYVPALPSQTVLNDYLAFTQIDAPKVVTPTYYHAYFAGIDPGYYGRIYVLGDNDAFWFSNQRNSLPATGYYGTYSLINQDETIDGIEYCNYSPFSTQRGLTVWDWHYIALPAYPSSSVCPPINGPLKEQVPVPVTIHQLQ